MSERCFNKNWTIFCVCVMHQLFFILCRAVPNVGPDVPDGLKPSNEDSMMVIFRAIVPLDIWEWDDQSKIYIRFGHPKFGNWKVDVGPGKRIRYNYVFVCTSMCCVLFVFTVDSHLITSIEMQEMAFTFSDLI